MDRSKMNQTELDFSCGMGLAKVNLYTGRLLYDCPGLMIGANSFQIGTSLIYNSHYKPTDFNGKRLGIGNGWKLNIQQYLFPYLDSYELDNFSEEDEDYVYIDSNWNIHRFVKYKSSNGYGNNRYVYYDSNGTGLRLIVGDNSYSEIYDGNTNIIRFNNQGNVTEVISAVNSQMIKMFSYDENNNLISICDSRKSTRKINFSYNRNNQLVLIQSTNSKISFNLIYEEGELVTISKSSFTKTKDMLYLKYETTKILKRVIDAESLRTLEFVSELSGDNRITQVKNGAMKQKFITEDCEPEVYAGENKYLGEEYFLTKTMKKISKVYLEMPDAYIKNKTSISYEDSYTNVIHDKNIITRYYFNINGFTTSILENEEKNNKTLFKTSGWELSTNGNSDYSINSKKANILSGTSYTANNDKLETFASEFKKYSNKEDSKYKYTENFVISFWLKVNKDITNDSKANLYVKKVKDRWLLKDIVDEIRNSVFIDKAKANAWQYVTIPVNLGQEQYNLDEISISFSNMPSESKIELADMRIAIGNHTSTIIYDENDSSKMLDLSKVKEFEFIELGVDNQVKTINVACSSNLFITEADLFATYKSLYYMKQKNQGYFDFVCCGGTKVFNVAYVSVQGKHISDDTNISISLKMNSDGVPNYYLYSSNRMSEKKWSITEVQNLFKVDENKKIYYEISTGIQLLESNQARIDKDKCSYTYEQKNIDGTDRATRDEYGIITSYQYDSYGNLEKIIVYNEKYASDKYEKLITEYDYADISEILREKPTSCKQNGITTYFKYYEPEFLPFYTLNGDSRLEYEYDEYKEKVISVKNKNNEDYSEVANTTIKYDQFGNIISASDKNGRTFGFVYNVFGDPLKYYENSRLLLEKNVEKSTDYDVITEKIYNNEKYNNGELVHTPYITKTTIDNYGRILSQKNYHDNIEDENHIDVVEFEYQSGTSYKESESVLKVNKIKDPYEKQTYTYIYDDENRPCGYETSGNSSEGVEKILVRQIGSGDTQYYFGADHKYYMSKIIKDDIADKNKPKFMNPRISKTQYLDMNSKEKDDVEENYKEVSFNYEYDKLGRLSSKNIDGIEYKDGTSAMNNSVSLEKNISYKSGTILPSKIEYSAITKNWDFFPCAHANMAFENTYDTKGNITNIKASGERFIENPVTEDFIDKEQLTERNYTYSYDVYDRLLKEVRSDDGVVKSTIEYDYSQTSDHLRSVSLNGTVIKSFKYEKGRKSNIKINHVSTDIIYDNYGNIVKDEKGTIAYNSRNLLETYNYNSIANSYTTETKKSTYKYNYQGVRFEKVIETYENSELDNTKKVQYFLDGSRILGEKQITQTGTKILKYLYDAEGITGINYDGYTFTFVKDSLGNVSKLMYQGKVIGEYVYDAWGNCTIIGLSIGSGATDVSRDSFVLHHNPFRWKSHYLDLETGLYYVNGRYYSPVLMQYLNADKIENITINEANTFDRHTITLDNSITYEVNQDTIFTNTQLYPDPKYEPILKKSWWELNWKKAVQWIAFTIVFIVSVVLMCTPAHAFGVGMFMAGLKAAISGAIIGGLIGGIINVIHGNSFMEGLVEGAVYGFINGFTTGALMYCASQAVSALSKAASNRCTSPGNCFIEGTVVLTAIGNKNIEDIEIGDKVWAYDEETGEKALKKVVQLFRNTTDKWIHLLFKNNETQVEEEFVCTPRHPFYVNNLGWVEADKLLENDEVLLYNNTKATLISKETELLEIPEATYNFEVEDYHTYFVGKERVLVHNECGGGVADDIANTSNGTQTNNPAQPDHTWATERRRYWKSQGELYKNNALGQKSLADTYDVTNNNVKRMLKGLAPKGIDGHSVPLHHVVGKSKDFYNYIEITRTNHYANFKALHPWRF